MPTTWNQFRMMMWKNWVLQKRKRCTSVFEIILPAFFAALLLIIRHFVKITTVNTPTQWDRFKPNSVEFHTFDGNSSKNEILYIPNTVAIGTIMNLSLPHLPDPPPTMTFTDWKEGPKYLNNNWTFRGFDSEDQLIRYYRMNHPTILAGVVFHNDFTQDIPHNILYSLRVSHQSPSKLWNTGNTYTFYQTTGYRDNEPYGRDPDYYQSGFLGLQYAVDVAVTKYLNKSSNFLDYEVFLKKMPFPPYVEDSMLEAIRDQLPTLIIFSFILITLQTTKGIVYEKESKLKESMKLIGISPFVYWSSWFLKTFIYFSLSCAIFTVLCFIPISGKLILPHSDASVIYIFLLCYSVSVIAYAFMISTFFSRANCGALASGVIYFLMDTPRNYLKYEKLAKSEKLSLCLLNNMALIYGLNTIAIYEGTGDGVHWDNFMHPATVDDNFSLLDSILMMLVDAVIFLLITWYVDGIHPGEFGIPLPWYFPFSKTYWCGSKQDTNFSTPNTDKADPKYFESEPTGRSAGISINHLRKEYVSKEKTTVAVVDTSLNIYEGEITALLGHNGAGKTTTMLVLTGFLPPTSGTAIINGNDICKDIRSVRNSLGLCPQHNILFDTMTVEEHLYFFAQLKGCQKNLLNSEIKEMMVRLGLEANKNTFSMHLSGGQKRKLSVGLALIGNSKVVILDEPTSGMDPAARRQTWDILRQYRNGKTIVLSTHSMDEADLLSDRIAIMSNGVLKCCGTSLFLKTLYGAGYHLAMVKEKDCDVTAVTTVIRRHISSAELESNVGRDISFLLPFEETPKFENLFFELENEKAKLKIASIGVSATTMEEVFTKVGKEDVSGNEVTKGSQHECSKAGDGPDGDHNNSSAENEDPEAMLPAEERDRYISFNADLKTNEGITWTVQQFWGLFMKKVIRSKREWKTTLTIVLVPITFIVLALCSDDASTITGNEPSLDLTLRPFPSSRIIYSSAGNSSSEMTISQVYADSFTSSGYSVEKYDYSELDAYDFEGYLLSRIDSFKKQMIVAGEFNNSDSGASITSYFNGEPLHASAISLGVMMNALLQYSTNKTFSVKTINNPFPKQVLKENDDRVVGESIYGLIIAMNVIFGMAFLTSSFITFLIKERSSGAKHLQDVSGAGSFVYWLSNFAWDMFVYLCPVIVIIICFGIFQTKAYTEENRWGLTFLMFFLYGWAVLPLVYLLSHVFSSPAVGMAVLTVLSIITGLATLIVVQVFEIISKKEIAETLDKVFTCLFSNYCLGQALINVYANYIKEDYCKDLMGQDSCDSLTQATTLCCKDKCHPNCLFEDDYTTWDVSGKYFLFMAVQGFIFSALVFMMEYGVLSAVRISLFRLFQNIGLGQAHAFQLITTMSKEIEDDDVLEEKTRIQNTSISTLGNTDSLILKNLRKTYGRYMYVAVKDICVGIRQEECFGLLGQNGAGKTSTFKMLTKDELISGGTAYFKGHDITCKYKLINQNLGYCPQFDALIGELTGREKLVMYARLRGIQEARIKVIVNELLDVMMLNEYADRECKTYSGGNKRKLSTAIALIGDPQFLLLDEPTTGMDPVAKRQLWNVLSQVRASGRTIILTSHSMEECDALCTRIAIMVNGSFACIGSPQHLKNKYGQGYMTINVRLALLPDGSIASAEPLKQFVASTFPNSAVFEDNRGYVRFHIPETDMLLGKLFGEFERNKQSVYIEDYSVHQTTLEQVFLSFANRQYTPQEIHKNGCLCF